MSKKYEEFFQLQKKAMSQVKRLNSTLSRQETIRQMLKVVTTGSTERDFAGDMEHRLSHIISKDEDIETKLTKLKEFTQDFNDEAGQFISWPPKRQNEEFAANFLVDLLDDEQFQRAMDSAIRAGFVKSESDFFYRTVRDFFTKNMTHRFASDVDKMVGIINNKISIRNGENNNNAKLQKINRVWLRSKKLL